MGGHWPTRVSLLPPLLALIILPGTAWAQSDTPLLRWEHFYRQRAFPFGQVPRGALQAARREAVARWPRIAAAPAAATSTWQPIGPERIPSSIRSTGRLVAIAIHPTGAVGSPAVILDTLVVAAPITLADAASHLLIGSVLDALQVAVLDSRGNADGVFNLGDVLAWLDHCASPTPDGCPAGASEAQQVGRTLERLKTTVPRDVSSGTERRDGRRR
ncbi:MAG: hypothetical protein GTN78_12365 [Gemmatimonadales bacterium]|nr:hypothetical protein [Gemmatimonadales bacterium]